LRFLNPFQYRVVVKASVLLEENITWHSLSYGSSASFVWWIWLMSLFLFFRIVKSSFGKLPKSCYNGLRDDDGGTG
jgi:hypothetical protein